MSVVLRAGPQPNEGTGPLKTGKRLKNAKDLGNAMRTTTDGSKGRGRGKKLKGLS